MIYRRQVANPCKKSERVIVTGENMGTREFTNSGNGVQTPCGCTDTVRIMLTPL
jgi:hypothetical protein